MMSTIESTVRCMSCLAVYQLGSFVRDAIESAKCCSRKL